MFLFGRFAIFYKVNRFYKQSETNAGKRLHFAQNDTEIKWIASSGILTIHGCFCYFKTSPSLLDRSSLLNGKWQLNQGKLMVALLSTYKFSSMRFGVEGLHHKRCIGGLINPVSFRSSLIRSCFFPEAEYKQADSSPTPSAVVDYPAHSQSVTVRSWLCHR